MKTLSDKKEEGTDYWADKNPTNYYYYLEKDVKRSLKELLNWINLSDELQNQEGIKYRHYIHKSNLRRRIKKIFGEELTKEESE